MWIICGCGLSVDVDYLWMWIICGCGGLSADYLRIICGLSVDVDYLWIICGCGLSVDYLWVWIICGLSAGVDYLWVRITCGCGLSVGVDYLWITCGCGLPVASVGVDYLRIICGCGLPADYLRVWIYRGELRYHMFDINPQAGPFHLVFVVRNLIYKTCEKMFSMVAPYHDVSFINTHLQSNPNPR